ncbi:GAF domain-containing protein [Paracraurococcus lichenis]|uniref:GAF domain-containing protein n=1 Tax=Paracraurococcus lichenis TaxID=3064888 RepID=A0ABT9E768_9PROT|nr:GAF domain-containing protein [Paracraurococcus sp. LOR1-02]MDO9711795.1 GAF domain-containing protein [Paracraurococcus sp. LOR1-02]
MAGLIDAGAPSPPRQGGPPGFAEMPGLAALRSYRALDGRSELVLDRLVDLAARIADCPVAFLSLAEPGHGWSRQAPTSFGPEREQAFCAEAVFAADGLLVVEDAAQDPRFADSPLVASERGMRFLAGLPLRRPDGRPRGTLCMVDRVPRALDAEQRGLLMELAGTIGAVLQLRHSARRGRLLSMTRL